MKIISNSFDEFDYNFVTSKQASNKQYTIFEFESISEVGHAPYGRELVLTKKNTIKTPKEGYVIFAGYCKSLVYSWKANNIIQVICKSNEKISIRTKVTKAHNINIEVVEVLL